MDQFQTRPRGDRRAEATQSFDEVVAELSRTRASDLLVVVRKLVRACELLDWTPAAQWFRAELTGFTPETAPPHRSAACTITWGSDLQDVFASSVGAAHPQVRPTSTFKPLINGLAELINYAPVGFSWETSHIQEANVLLLRRTVTFREKVTFHPSAVRDVLNRIEQHCYDFSIQAERQLRFGDLTTDLFAEYRARVERLLAKLQVSERLDAIETNLRTGTPESCKLAVHGCRNLLISLSAKLWQVEGLNRHPTLLTHDGKPLQLDAGQVKARLRAYLHERNVQLTSERGGPSLIAGQLERLADVFDQLYNASSEHAKHEATLEEAKAATLQTYFLIGEIARLTGLDPITDVQTPAAS